MRNLQLSFKDSPADCVVSLIAVFDAGDSGALAFNESIVALCKSALEKKNAKASAAGDRTDEAKTAADA